eukprot:293691-Alexandrium_andersonii.AAC.1
MRRGDIGAPPCPVHVGANVMPVHSEPSQTVDSALRSYVHKIRRGKAGIRRRKPESGGNRPGGQAHSG